MALKVFVLLDKKHFTFNERVFIKRLDGTLSQRTVVFSKKSKVKRHLRTAKSAIKYAAEYVATDQFIEDGLLRDPGYGTTFIQKGDEKLELKRLSYDITSSDAKRCAIIEQLDELGIQHEKHTPNAILEEKLGLYWRMSSSKNGTTAPMGATHTPIDITKQKEDQVAAAKQKYEDKYGEPVPAEFENDFSFLDAVMNIEGFDAKGHIEKAMTDVDAPEDETSDTKADTTNTADKKKKLAASYFKKTGENVPRNKVNDFAWIEAKLAE